MPELSYDFWRFLLSVLATDDHCGDKRGLSAYRGGVGSPSDSAIYTGTIEGLRNQFKRGIVDAYHKVMKKTLYVAEFEFRYNNRQNSA